VWDTYSCGTGLCHEGYKANVTKAIQFSNIFPQLNNFACNKGVLPLKISWDNQLFYSDSLPFQQNNPAPNGQGRLYFNCSFCQASENLQPVNHINGEVLVCDSMCTSRDSIVIYNILGTNDSVAWASFFFYIEQWSNGWIAI